MNTKTNPLSRRDFIRQASIGAAGIGLTTSLPFSMAQAATIKNGMAYRTLGKTGQEISEIILGAGPIVPSKVNLVRAALAQGITYIDTAWSYGKGQSEEAIGRVLKATGGRDKLILASKASSLNHKNLYQASSTEVEKAIRGRLEESLQRLHTDYIDVYFCPHAANRVEHVAYPALREALDKFKKEGKIRYAAISTHTRYLDVSMAAIESGFYDVLMPVLSPTTLHTKIYDATLSHLNQNREGKKPKGRPILYMRDVVKAAQKHNIGLIAMKAAKDGFNPPAIYDLAHSELAKDKKLSFHQVAYRYTLDQPGIHGVNIGMGNLKHLKEALVLPETSLKG